MATSVSQTLQKLHFTILGVPMDIQMQDIFTKKVEAEGWGWLNSIINDYLGYLANTSSHASVINMLAKNGWGLQLPQADLDFGANTSRTATSRLKDWSLWPCKRWAALAKTP